MLHECVLYMASWREAGMALSPDSLNKRGEGGLRIGVGPTFESKLV